MTHAKREDIIKRIRKAFLGVERPPDEKLLHFPNTGGELWVDRFLGTTETDWIDISPENVAHECWALTVLSPPAFAYYLPAYVTWVLKNYDVCSSSTLDHTLYDLDLTGRDENTRSMMEQRFSVLTEEQGQAVLEFLKYMIGIKGIDSKAARDAIASYWDKFEEGKT